jgi:hypothetical protein
MTTQFTVEVEGSTITWSPNPDLAAHLSTAPPGVQIGLQCLTAEPLRLVAGLLHVALSGGNGSNQLIQDLNAALGEVAQRALIRSGN